MTYLGNAPSAGGFVFMWLPNNVLFYATHCIFDETLFPKCSSQVPQPVTWLQRDVPTHSHHQDDVEEESAHPHRIPIPPRQQPVEEEQTSVPVPLPEVIPPPRTPLLTQNNVPLHLLPLLLLESGEERPCCPLNGNSPSKRDNSLYNIGILLNNRKNGTG